MTSRSLIIAFTICTAVTSARAESLSLKDALGRAVASNPLLTEGRLGWRRANRALSMRSESTTPASPWMPT